LAKIAVLHPIEIILKSYKDVLQPLDNYLLAKKAVLHPKEIFLKGIFDVFYPLEISQKCYKDVL
jgi:hypothetical protein